MKGQNELQDFVKSLEMTVLTDEDSVLLDGSVGAKCHHNFICHTDDNCSKTKCPRNGGNNGGGNNGGSDNCYGGNCVSGCDKTK